MNKIIVKVDCCSLFVFFSELSVVVVSICVIYFILTETCSTET